MNSREDLERVDVERVMAEEKQLTTLEALKTRIKQHEAAFLLAARRIAACKELALRAPSETVVLRGVIEIWERNRRYHERILEESRQLGAEIARSLPDPAP